MGSQDIFSALGWLKTLAALGAAAVFLWRPLKIESRHFVVGCAAVWTLVATYEFWILGDHSFSALGAEIEYSIPGIMFLNAAPVGAKYLPGLGGGVDSYAFATFSGQYISLERLLLLLPLGLASFLHKSLLVGIAFGGMYRLARSFKGVDRASAFIAAALFSLSHERLLLMTWSHGLGFALVPLACYVVVRRSSKANYYPALLGLAGLNAISCTPTHSFLAVLAGIVAVAMVSDFKNDLRLGRIFVGVAILIFAVIANWHEGLYAKSLIGPLTARGAGEPSIWPAFNFLFLFIGLVSFVVLGRKGNLALAVQFMAAVLVILFSGSIIYLVATTVPALAAMKAINFQNASVALFTLVPLAAVCALRSASNQSLAEKGIKALFSGLPVGYLAWLKIYIPLVWLSQGGLAVVSDGMSQLQSKPWMPAESIRVVSLPYRLPSNVAAAAGLDTLDGFYPLIYKRMETFWNGILAPKHVDTISGSLSLDDANIDYKCCGAYELGQYANLDLLRVANVGFILSVLPLSDAALTQVAGPTEDFAQRANAPLIERFKSYASMILKSAPIRVYALKTPLPRLYSAQALRVLPAETTEADLLQAIERYALNKEIVVLEGEKMIDAEVKAPVEINAWSVKTDGLHADITAPDTGVLVFNAAFTPFWRAYVDGRPTSIFPANMAQMAIAVPGGARDIVFRYERPLLREKIAQFLH